MKYLYLSSQLKGMIDLSKANGGPLNIVVSDKTKISSTIQDQVERENLIVTRSSDLANKVNDSVSNLGTVNKKKNNNEEKIKSKGKNSESKSSNNKSNKDIKKRQEK